jgi:hypothetical protein
MNTAQEAPARPAAKKPETVTVLVNEKPVVMPDKKLMGAEIKATAINQGATIQLDFSLFEVKGQGNLKQVGDTEEVSLHPNQKFRAVAPDDNS